MLSRFLREILFNLVHFIVNILVAVRITYHKFWVEKLNSSKNDSINKEIKMILEDVPKMSKRLKHLVVLADISHQSISDLARLVIWSLVAGVPYVSFYDVTGALKEYEEKLFFEVERNKKGVPGYIKWSNKPDLNGYTNGNQAHTIVINIFMCNDGRATIAQCIRMIAEKKIPCERKSKEITAQELNEALKFVYPSIPDPDIILYTGPLCRTHGLLPWHIRLTEFIQLSLDHSININSYLGALSKYNKCDQRFGK